MYILMLGMLNSSVTYSMISEVVKLFHHNLFEHVQVSYQNIGLLTDVKPALILYKKYYTMAKL